MAEKAKLPMKCHDVEQDIKTGWKVFKDKTRGPIETFVSNEAKFVSDTDTGKICFLSGNSCVKGVIYLHKNPMTFLADEVIKSDEICMVDVPASLMLYDLINFIAPAEGIKSFKMITRDTSTNQYMVLVKFKNPILGRHKSDLTPVKIIVHRSAKEIDILNLAEVLYQNNMEEEHTGEVAGIITPYECCSLADRIPCLTEELNTRLQPLKEELVDLTSLFTTPEISEDWAWKVPKDAHLSNSGTLSRMIMNSFLYNMNLSVGKEAFRMLVSNIVSKLQLKKLHVMQAGCNSFSGYLSTLVEIDVSKTDIKFTSKKKSSIIENFFSSPVLFELETQKMPEDLPEYYRYSSNKNIKPMTADVLVYSQSRIDRPIQAELVISIIEGTESSIHDLVVELLSRLPYQSGPIFGVQLNVYKAMICSVELADPDGSGRNTVPAFNYHPYVFRRFGEPFDLNSFFNLILDIGRILTRKT